MTSRRGFLSAILVGVTAPAIVSASSIMRVKPVVQDGMVWWDEAITRTDGTIWLQPTRLIVPAHFRDVALKIINSEFDKEYKRYKQTMGIA